MTRDVYQCLDGLNVTLRALTQTMRAFDVRLRDLERQVIALKRVMPATDARATQTLRIAKRPDPNSR